MRSPLLLPVTAFGLALVCFCAYAEKNLRIVELTELRMQDSYDLPAARAWKLPEQVSFAVEELPVTKGDSLEVGGWLSNASLESQLVVIFPVGTLGFYVKPINGVSKSLGPLLPMPAPPPPLLLTLPAHSRVHLATTLKLSDWEWDAREPRKVEWSFLFWNEPKPSGRIMIP